MRSKLCLLVDPMIVVLVIAIALAVLLPVQGEGAGYAKQFVDIGIFVLFLANGIRVARGELLHGLTNWRFFLPLTLWVFGVMALAGLGIAKIADGHLPALVALGFVYLGSLPSTVQSATSYTTLAEGNIALAVVGAAMLNILGVFVSAPLFALLGGGAVASFGTEAITRIGMILILPFVIGQIVQKPVRAWVLENKAHIVWLDRIVIGSAVYVAFSGAISNGLGQDLSLANWLVMVAFVLGFLALAKIGAWSASGLLGYKRADRITFLFSGAQKSVAIGAPLAAILFSPAQAGFVIAPLLVYHLAQLVVAAPLASYLARNSG